MLDRDYMQPVIGLLIISGLFATTVLLFFIQMPDNAKEVILMLIGVLSKSFGDVVGYYFGSTAGSSAKDKTIAAMATSTGTGESK